MMQTLEYASVSMSIIAFFGLYVKFLLEATDVRCSSVFITGAMRSIVSIRFVMTGRCFHPKLVRLEDQISVVSRELPANVSIPNWFD